MKRITILSGLIFSLLLCFTVTVFAKPHDNPNQCNSHNEDNCPVPTQICNNGEHVGNPHCLPTIGPSVIPTVSVTVTLPEPSLTPEVISSPSATPTPSNTEDNKNTSDGRSDGLSSCSDCTKTHEAPAIILPPCTKDTCGYK